MNAKNTSKQARSFKRHSHQEREQIIQQYEKSGLSRKAFAKKIGILPATFYAWFKPDMRHPSRAQKKKTPRNSLADSGVRGSVPEY